MITIYIIPEGITNIFFAFQSTDILNICVMIMKPTFPGV